MSRVINFIKNQFNITNKYIKEYVLKIAVILAVAFLVLGILSYLIVLLIPQYATEIYNTIMGIMNVEGMLDEHGISLTVSLFLNNIRATVFTYLYGFIPFLFFPVFSLIINSSIVGFVLGVVEVATDENVLLSICMFLLPHGIFEIPALVLSSAAGTRLCYTICKKIFRIAKDEKIKFHFQCYLRMLVFYIIPLLVIAAFVEGIVVPWLFL